MNVPVQPAKLTPVQVAKVAVAVKPQTPDKVERGQLSKVPSSPTLDWPVAPSTFSPKCGIIGIWGPSDSGKSTLAHTGKSPIVSLYSNVEKFEGIAEAATAKGKVVHPYHFGGFSGAEDPYLRAIDYMEYLREFRSRFIDSWSFARSIVMDTDSDVWRLIRRSYHGDLAPKPKHSGVKDHRFFGDGNGNCVICGENGKTGDRRANWGAPNDEWFSLFDCAKDQQRQGNHCDLILISKSVPIYRDHRKTRNLERKSQGDVDTMCNVIVQTESWQDIQTLQTTYQSTIIKPWNQTFAQGRKADNWDGLNTIPGIMSYVTGEYDEGGNLLALGDEEVWR